VLKGPEAAVFLTLVSPVAEEPLVREQPGVPVPVGGVEKAVRQLLQASPGGKVLLPRQLPETVEPVPRQVAAEQLLTCRLEAHPPAVVQEGAGGVVVQAAQVEDLLGQGEG
jgi:hypothetical protein